ncbi:MAG: ABC transporter permease subunit [Desulfobacterales bacterium]|nr:ABC transporter permease subunit [Desulfobacterales bacterium]
MSSLPKQTPLPWNRPEYRAFFYQFLVVLTLVAIGWYLLSNTLENLQRQNIATGFAFLGAESAFEIGESLIPYAPTDSYARALLVGSLNTVKTAVIGIVLTVLLGTVMGIARLSKNGLIAGLAAVYVELFRNIPVLLQLFFWYALFHQLPGPRQALEPFSGVFVCSRGFLFPAPRINGPEGLVLLLVPLALLLGWWLCRKNRIYCESHGKNRIHPAFLSLVPVLLVLGANVVAGATWQMDVPALQGFNIRGGGIVTPEFGALLLGLVIYTGTFVAEIVRSGILAVDKGQVEAAKSLGLSNSRILYLIVLPQALRVIIPPLTSQMLNLTKNSTLAVAVGYPDLVSVANTTLNQTGQAIEAISIIMVVYLVFSLVTSLFMNWFNKRAILPS